MVKTKEILHKMQQVTNKRLLKNKGVVAFGYDQK